MYGKHLSINAIARLLNRRRVLRNPAYYYGKACYGKKELRPRQRITRPLRQMNGLTSRNSANHERPRSEWIEVPVPALVAEETFALAQGQSTKNKHHRFAGSSHPVAKRAWA